MVAGGTIFFHNRNGCLESHPTVGGAAGSENFLRSEQEELNISLLKHGSSKAFNPSKSPYPVVLE